MMDEQPRYPRGVEMLRDAEHLVVGGVKRMNLLDAPEHYPVFFSRAQGPHAWDVDGHRYIDLISGKGSILLGYADPRVDGAVHEAISRGSMLPLTSDLYPQAARSVTTLMPSMERVKFLRTGSCAVAAAVRLSRVVTGRTRVLSCGYHGWHDWYIQERRPYPDATRPVIDIHYDRAWLEELAERHGDEIAAIVVTPEPTFIDPSFERAAAEIARSIGAVFVLDEMKTGFRFGPGGYGEMIGVRADLTTIGKALANGYALTAVGGRQDIMEAERETHISGTYETENIGLAAGIATTAVLPEQDYAGLAAMYARFAGTMNEAFEARGVAARCATSAFNAQLVFEDDETATAFYRAAASRGVTFYCFDDVNLSFAHAAVFDELLGAVVQAVDSLPRGGSGGSVTPDAVLRYLRRHRTLSGKSAQDEVLAAAFERVMGGAPADALTPA